MNDGSFRHSVSRVRDAGFADFAAQCVESELLTAVAVDYPDYTDRNMDSSHMKGDTRDNGPSASTAGCCAPAGGAAEHSGYEVGWIPTAVNNIHRRMTRSDPIEMPVDPFFSSAGFVLHPSPLVYSVAGYRASAPRLIPDTKISPKYTTNSKELRPEGIYEEVAARSPCDPLFRGLCRDRGVLPLQPRNTRTGEGYLTMLQAVSNRDLTGSTNPKTTEPVYETPEYELFTGFYPGEPTYAS